MNSRHLHFFRKGQIEEPAVNLTPLIDVVFVILIMFIVVAPLLELDRVELAEAPSAHPDKSLSAQETSPIAIHVQPDNTIWINGQATNHTQLVERLKHVKRLHPHARPQLFHDRNAYFGTYQTVKNAAEAAGFQQMDVILNPA